MNTLTSTTPAQAGSAVRPAGRVRRIVQRVSFALASVFVVFGLHVGPAAAVDSAEQTAVKGEVSSSFSNITDLLTTTLVPALFALVGIATLIWVGVKYAKKARGAAA